MTVARCSLSVQVLTARPQSLLTCGPIKGYAIKKPNGHVSQVNDRPPPKALGEAHGSPPVTRIALGCSRIANAARFPTPHDASGSYPLSGALTFALEKNPIPEPKVEVYESPDGVLDVIIRTVDDELATRDGTPGRRGPFTEPKQTGELVKGGSSFKPSCHPCCCECTAHPTEPDA